MAYRSISERLKAIGSSPAGDKSAAYSALLDQVLSSSTSAASVVEDVAEITTSIISDQVGVVTARGLLSYLVTNIGRIESPDDRITIGTRILEVIAPKVVSFEDQDTAIKHILADAHEANEDFVESAKVLQTVTLDSSQRSVSDNDKAKTWIRITRCYLEVDDPTSALSYLNRIKNIIFSVTDQATRLHFQLSQARISDSQRNFADASRTYYQISYDTAVDEDECLHALSAAVRCAILAPAGPQRAQQLSKLFRDDRATQIEEYGILEKIFLDRVLTGQEVKAFAEKLEPHQLAVTSDGSTVLDKAVLEHNLLAASRLYNNIGTAQLGAMLGVDGEKAEVYAAQMIEQGRLAGYIDQVDELIFFEDRKAAAGSGTREGRVWDENVRGLAEEVERVTTMIQTDHPDFYAANMVH